YRMPGYKLHGKPMLYFRWLQEHYSLFAASGTFFAAFEYELMGYELRKGDGPFPTHQTGTGEAHQPDCEAACGWDRRHGEKAAAGPREIRAQVGTVGDRAAHPRDAVGCKAVICQKPYLDNDHLSQRVPTVSQT